MTPPFNLFARSDRLRRFGGVRPVKVPTKMPAIDRLLRRGFWFYPTNEDDGKVPYVRPESVGESTRVRGMSRRRRLAQRARVRFAEVLKHVCRRISHHESAVVALRFSSGNWKRAVVYGFSLDGRLDTSAGLWGNWRDVRMPSDEEPWHGASAGSTL